MFLAFVLSACFVLLFRLSRKPFNKRSWTIVILLTFLVSFILAFVSIWSVWTPYVTNWDFHSGEFDGCFPWSKLSYPLTMSVYHTPFARLLYDGMWIRGNVSFNMFLANLRIMQVNGTFTYPPVFGKVPLSYSLNFPLFSTGETFFVFLTVFFTLVNIAGASLGLALTSTLKRIKASWAIA